MGYDLIAKLYRGEDVCDIDLLSNSDSLLFYAAVFFFVGRYIRPKKASHRGWSFILCCVCMFLESRSGHLIRGMLEQCPLF